MNLLSKRELEIVRSVAQGLTNREIAEQLHLSPHTIKNCLFRIFDKLGVSNRVELLFMTLSQDCHAKSALEYFFENPGKVSLQDEATLVACQRAAEQGTLMAQLALAQFYSANRKNPHDMLRTYAWYSIVSERISRAWKDVAKTMTVDEVLEAEQLAARWLDSGGKSPSMQSKGEARRRRSMTREEPLEKAVG